MSTQVQHRRGTSAQHAAFTGAIGEITYDVDKKSIVAHDGNTPGGFPAMRERTYDPDGLLLPIAAFGKRMYRADTPADVAALDLSLFDCCLIDKYLADCHYYPTMYQREAAEPTHMFKFQDGAGNWFGLTGNTIDWRQVGVRQTAASDNAISNRNQERANGLFMYLKGVGGGTAIVPPGTTFISPSNGNLLYPQDNTNLVGFGIGVSLIKTRTNWTGQARGIRIGTTETVTNGGSKNIMLTDFSFDGGERERPTSGEGIGLYAFGWLDNVRVIRCEFGYCRDYGMGIQVDGAKHLRILDCWVHHTRTDGVDFKNFSDGNEDIIIENLRLDNCCQGRNDYPAALDCRGFITIVNPQIRVLGGNRIGIRFRHGNENQGTLGGAFGQIRGGYIYCDANPEGVSGTAKAIETYGPSIRIYGTTTVGTPGHNSEGISMRSGNVRIKDTAHYNHLRGLVGIQDWVSKGNTRGILIDGSIVLADVGVNTARGVSLDEATGAIVRGVMVQGYATGIAVGSTCVDTRVQECDVVDNVVRIANSSTGTRINSCRGYKTRGMFTASITPALGDNAVSIPHDLAGSPLSAQTLVSVFSTGAATGTVKVVSADASNVNLVYNCTATGGAVRLQVDTSLSSGQS